MIPRLTTSRRFIVFMLLLFALQSPALACDNGFFIISCYSIGSSCYCPLGYYSGTGLWTYGWDTLTDCSDCHFDAGHVFVYYGELDCDGDYQYISGYGCCGLYS
jgi:hypothetical protein